MEPELSTWGERLRERTEPLQPPEVDEEYGWAHAILCETLAKPFLQLAELVDPEDPMPPWGPLFDADSCPSWALPWLAQATGARLPSGLSDEDARAFIRNVAGHSIGTRASMVGAVQPTLVPSNPPEPATLWFRERDTSAYRLEVVTLTAETPNPAETLRVLQLAKPAGIVLSHRTVDSWDYQQMEAEGGTYAQLKTRYATYRTLREHDQI